MFLIAASRGHVDIIDMFIDMGEDPIDGLLSAASSGNVKSVILFLNKGIDHQEFLRMH